MKIVEKIPSMSDNELSSLFNNALELIEKNKMVAEANIVLTEIQKEWNKRLQEFNAGNYKADTPEKGVLRTIGYHVGNDGIGEKKRRLLIDYLLSGELPPVGSPAHMAEWGNPNSRERYRKAHRVIQVLKSSAKTLGNMSKAEKEWGEDLRYMEEKWSHLK